MAMAIVMTMLSAWRERTENRVSTFIRKVNVGPIDKGETQEQLKE